MNIKLSRGDVNDFLVVLIPVGLLIVGIFLHEMGHAVMIIVTGNNFLGFEWGLVSYTNWEPTAFIEGEWFMVGFAGGLFESMFYAFVALRFRPAIPLVVGSLFYGTFEGLWLSTHISTVAYLASMFIYGFVFCMMSVYMVYYWIWNR